MSYRFDGDFTVACPREEVYAVLSDPSRFAPLLPTYQSHETNGDGAATVKVKVGVGKVRGTGEVQLNREVATEFTRAAYSGKGKVMGGVFELRAGFELEEAGADRTRVNWEGEMTMYGKLVSLAGGMVKPVAKRDINRLIEALQDELGGAVEVAPAKPGLFKRFLAWLKRLFGLGSGHDKDR